MLRKFAAVLLATALVAGPAFAAQSSDSAGATPAAATTGVNAKVQTSTSKPTKPVMHARNHVRKHIARAKVGTMKQARHVKSTKTHQANVSKSKGSKAAGRPA
jgi:negative regulator of sigma E activity